jgi:hypothetical protein
MFRSFLLFALAAMPLLDLATFQRTLFFLPPNDCSNSTGL